MHTLVLISDIVINKGDARCTFCSMGLRFKVKEPLSGEFKPMTDRVRTGLDEACELSFQFILTPNSFSSLPTMLSSFDSTKEIERCWTAAFNFCMRSVPASRVVGLAFLPTSFLLTILPCLLSADRTEVRFKSRSLVCLPKSIHSFGCVVRQSFLNSGPGIALFIIYPLLILII
jgi:hypothetical protein